MQGSMGFVAMKVLWLDIFKIHEKFFCTEKKNGFFGFFEWLVWFPILFNTGFFENILN
jgi:hypothetical protein